MARHTWQELSANDGFPDETYKERGNRLKRNREAKRRIESVAPRKHKAPEDGAFEHGKGKGKRRALEDDGTG
jgi:hypothetical protein